jgi:hypothetical protein
VLDSVECVGQAWGWGGYAAYNYASVISNLVEGCCFGR